MRKLIGTIVAVAAMAVVSAGPAAATSTVAVEREGGVTWVQSSLDGGDHSTVDIRIYSKQGRTLRLWQRCSLPFAGAGAYSCGIDTSAGSIADRLGGEWVAKVLVDGAKTARHSFTI